MGRRGGRDGGLHRSSRGRHRPAPACLCQPLLPCLTRGAIELVLHEAGEGVGVVCRGRRARGDGARIGALPPTPVPPRLPACVPPASTPGRRTGHVRERVAEDGLGHRVQGLEEAAAAGGAREEGGGERRRVRISLPMYSTAASASCVLHLRAAAAGACGKKQGALETRAAACCSLLGAYHSCAGLPSPNDHEESHDAGK